MLFTEESNYFNNNAVNGAPDSTAWRPNQTEGSSLPTVSKLNSWAAKQRQKENSFGSGNGTDDEQRGWNAGNTTARHTPQDFHNKMSWSDPLNPDQLGGSLQDDFMAMSLGPGGPNGVQKMPPSNGGAQWGRAEINQTTPWEAAANFEPGPGPRFMPGGVNMDNGGGQWRSWEHDGGFQKDFHPFPMSGMPNAGKQMPNNFYGGHNFVMQPGFGDNRMMRNGPPHMNQQQQQQPWDKYGGGSGGMPGGGGGGGRGNFQQFGAPPQAAPMNMMPPSMLGQRVMGPPPPLASQHHGRHHHHPNGPPPPPMVSHLTHMPGGPQGGPQPGVGNYNVGGFNQPGSMISDDSYWHDPNGDLRKWQRDTGTAHWGDPSKQQGVQIRRWTGVNGEEDLGCSSNNNQASPDSLKKDDEDDQNAVPETGWGELPPLNGSAPTHNSHVQTPQTAGNAGGWINAGPGSSGLGPQGGAPGGGGWDSQRSLPPNNFIPPAAQFPPNNFYGGSALPPGPSNDWRPPSNMTYASQQPQLFDSGVNSNKDIAEKLRLAANKGLIDINLFSSAGPLPANIVKLLNSMLDVFTEVEQLDNSIEQLKRNGDRNEADRRQIELNGKRAILEELRDKINSSLGGGPQRPQARSGGLSLADELTNMNSLPPIGDVAQLW